jgi:aspartate carbamoyltransferase catalytic subunit
MKNLISIDQISIENAFEIFDLADKYLANPVADQDLLKSKILVNFFFENSTRTRTSFEIAGKRAGVRVINIDISISSLKKGESIIDMSKTINAMSPDFVVIRHNSSGIMSILQKYFDRPCIINAGDGTNEHPTQALLDAFTIKKYKNNFAGLRVAICGDVLHSRVARSNIKLLTKLGCKISVVTPQTLITKHYKEWLLDNWNVELCSDLEMGIKDADVIIMLRIQQERMQGCYIPSLSEYFKYFGLTQKNIKLAKPDVLVLHPGPINRDVEISSALADDKNRSAILEQVEFGVVVRQALLSFLSF